MNPVGARDRLQSGERFETGVARNFVARELPCLVGLFAAGWDHRGVHRHELGIEAMVRDRTRRTELRFQPEAIGIVARNSVFGGDPLRAFKLAREFITLPVLASDRFAVPRLDPSDSVGA